MIKTGNRTHLQQHQRSHLRAKPTKARDISSPSTSSSSRSGQKAIRNGEPRGAVGDEIALPDLVKTPGNEIILPEVVKSKEPPKLHLLVHGVVERRKERCHSFIQAGSQLTTTTYMINSTEKEQTARRRFYSNRPPRPYTINNQNISTHAGFMLHPINAKCPLHHRVLSLIMQLRRQQELPTSPLHFVP